MLKDGGVFFYSFFVVVRLQLFIVTFKCLDICRNLAETQRSLAVNTVSVFVAVLHAFSSPPCLVLSAVCCSCVPVLDVWHPACLSSSLLSAACMFLFPLSHTPDNEMHVYLLSLCTFFVLDVYHFNWCLLNSNHWNRMSITAASGLINVELHHNICMSWSSRADKY